MCTDGAEVSFEKDERFADPTAIECTIRGTKIVGGIPDERQEDGTASLRCNKRSGGLSSAHRSLPCIYTKMSLQKNLSKCWVLFVSWRRDEQERETFRR